MAQQGSLPEHQRKQVLMAKPEDKQNQSKVDFSRPEDKQDQSKIFYKLCKASFRDGTPTKVLIPIVRGVAAKSILRAIAPAQCALPQTLSTGFTSVFPSPSIPTGFNAPTAGNFVIVNPPCTLISQPQSSTMQLPMSTGPTTIQNVPPGMIVWRLPTPGTMLPQPLHQSILNTSNVPMTQLQRGTQIGQNLPMGFVLANSLQNPTIVSKPGGISTGGFVQPTPSKQVQSRGKELDMDPRIPEVVIKLGKGAVQLSSDPPKRYRPKRKAATRTSNNRRMKPRRVTRRLNVPYVFQYCYVSLERIDMSYLKDGSVNLLEVTEEQLFGDRCEVTSTRQPAPCPIPPELNTVENTSDSSNDKVAVEPSSNNNFPNVPSKFDEPSRTQIEKLKDLLVIKLAAVENLSRK